MNSALALSPRRLLWHNPPNGSLQKQSWKKYKNNLSESIYPEDLSHILFEHARNPRINHTLKDKSYPPHQLSIQVQKYLQKDGILNLLSFLPFQSRKQGRFFLPCFTHLNEAYKSCLQIFLNKDFLPTKCLTRLTKRCSSQHGLL